MGRPVSKKFFGDPASPGYQIAVSAWFTGEGAPEAAYIVSQRSNSVYVVGSTADDGDPENPQPLRTGSLKLVDGAPAAAGQMQVVVTPTTSPGDNLVLGGHADFDGVGDNGTFAAGEDYEADDELTLSNGAVVTVLTVDGVTGAVETFTIDTAGSFVTAGSTLTATGGAGTGFSLTLGADNVEAAAPVAESARIINQHTVKTFDDNVYSWRDGVSPERPLAIIGS